ncbi:MAG: protein-L-isoaspartate(D-aspartate) O-methyltransferase [Nanoarchaeota archaeon]|mgnify:CR=1 FL=1
MDFKLKLLLDELISQNIKDKNVLKAIEEIKRDLFVPKNLREEAYENHPLSIGHNQTISQPYTTAFMLQNLELKYTDKVLEIGTGSGWSTSLIGYIAEKVYSIETVKELVKSAKENIKKTKLKNIKVFNQDGSKGLSKYSPYDKIIVNAACSQVPYNLIKQLKNNGILVCPVGNLYEQRMLKITKIKNKIRQEDLGGFIFVPLVSDEYGF